MKSSYDIKEFIAACTDINKVDVLYGAQQTAQKDFNLNTAQEILNFIFNDGLEKLEPFNTEAWDKNPKPEICVMVDAYEFYSGHKFGYIAFLKNPVTEKWVIKSLKKNARPDSASFPFREALEGFKLQDLEE